MKAAIVAWLGLLSIGLPSPGMTQGSQPLRKTDVIRLLSNPMISKGEVADLIRRNCVAFRPTPRDWTDLREFGADTEVLSSIGGCATAPGTARGASPVPLTAALLTERVSVMPGGDVVVRVQVKRGDVPQAGIPLVLRGSARIPGGPSQDVQAVTAAGGMAFFQFPAGRVPGTYRLDVITGSGFAFPATPPIDVVVIAAAPATAEVRPARVDLRAGQRGPVSLVVAIRDSSGSPVSGEAVTLQPDAPDLGVSADARSTDSLGRAVFVFDRSAVRRAGTLTIRVRGQPLGSVDLVRTDVVAPAVTGFVSGVGQRGMARTRLNEPLVFQARSILGKPLAGKVVIFDAVNAQVTADSVVTDSAGMARVDVTLGKQAGPALVTATVDSLQRQAALTVEPAAPVAVIIERDGVRVDGGTVTVAAGRTFVVRVAAQDTYGNAVPTADLARMIQQTRNRFNLQSRLLKMISVESDGSGANVTFRPAGVGQADLTVAGATVSVTVSR